jgi:hypothetical protein
VSLNLYIHQWSSIFRKSSGLRTQRTSRTTRLLSLRLRITRTMAEKARKMVIITLENLNFLSCNRILYIFEIISIKPKLYVDDSCIVRTSGSVAKPGNRYFVSARRRREYSDPNFISTKSFCRPNNINSEYQTPVPQSGAQNLILIIGVLAMYLKSCIRDHSRQVAWPNCLGDRLKRNFPPGAVAFSSCVGVQRDLFASID